MMYQGGWFGMGTLGLFWIVLIVIAVLLAVWAIGRANVTRTRTGDESPEEILKRRYARGEIDRDEYHRRLDDLRR
jgi:putative membrane protein